MPGSTVRLQAECQLHVRDTLVEEYQIDALSDKLDISTSQLLVSMLSLEMKQIVTQKAGKIFQLR